MTTALQLRRGTTAQHSTFTGSIGEVTVDTTKKTVVVQDGVTAGGTPLAKEADVTNKLRFDTATGLDATQQSNVRKNTNSAPLPGANGIVVRNGVDSTTNRAIAAGSGISVANPDGVSGNPTVTNTGVLSVNGQTGAVTISTGEAIPAGIVAHFANSSPPTGWLKANGALVSRATYAELFAAIGTVYGAGNGSTTFKLPDLRGEFLRGFDDARGVDSGRTIGSAQSSQNLSHNHGGSTGGASSLYNPGNGSAGGNEAPTIAGTSHAHSIPSDGGSESRPRNIAMLACIKF